MILDSAVGSTASRKRTIALIIPSSGGLHYVARSCAEELRKRGFSVVGLEVVDTGWPAATALCTAVRMRRSLRDVSHVHVDLGSTAVGAFWLGLFVSLIRRGGVVTTVHDGPGLVKHPGSGLISTAPGLRNFIAYRILSASLDRPLRWLYRLRCRQWFVFSESAADELRRMSIRPVAVLQLGGDPPTASAPPSAGQTVVFAGYISPAKGLDTLVEAWKLGKCYQHLQLRVAGHASATHLAYAEKQRSALFAFDPESQWLGFVSDERLKDLIAQAAVVVLPYRQSSAASGVLSRAMVEGRAVIATPVPALIPHVTNRSTGIVIPVDDPAALASAIEELAGDATLRDALGSAAAIHAAQEFTWSAQVDGLLSVFNGG